MRKLAILGFGVALVGCSGSSNSSVTAEEEKMFKNPPPIDRSKIPANPFSHKGPSFIGAPSVGSGAAPPPAAANIGGQ